MAHHGYHLGEPNLLPTRLSQACAVVLEADGAGVTAFSGTNKLPLGASGPEASVAEMLQFSNGEGPCFSAFHTNTTVYAGPEVLANQWPTLHEELLARTPYRAILSLPIQRDRLAFGVLELYFRDPHAIELYEHWSWARTAAGTVADALLDPAGSGRPGWDQDWLDSPAAISRNKVWQAIGLLIGALALSSSDALAYLRGYSFSRSMSVEDAAHALIDRTLPVEEVRDYLFR